MQKKENKKKTTLFCPSSSNKPIVVILIMTRYKLTFASVLSGSVLGLCCSAKKGQHNAVWRCLGSAGANVNLKEKRQANKR